MFRSLLVLAPLLAAGLAVAEEPAESPTAARLTDTRAGTTRQGATRVVFETDRPVEFLAVELPATNGFEIHLLGTDTTAVPAARAINDERVTGIEFRAGKHGLVARVLGRGTRMTARSFPLSNPPRVVVDLTPVEDATGPAPIAPEAEPRLADAPAVRTKPTAASAAEAAPPRDPEPETSPATTIVEADPAPEPASIFEEPDATGKVTGRGSEFSDLLAWLQTLQAKVEALNFADDEEERAKYRRALAFQLARRGLYDEAEKALVSSLTSEARDRSTAVADSVHLAELRLKRGNGEGASETARQIDVSRATPFQKVRLANVLLETGFPALAVDLLDDARPNVDGAAKARATLLLARARWDQNEPERALDLARELTQGDDTPAAIFASALILEADCLVATERPASAHEAYDRAAKLDISDEEASWVGLQQGNLARREGKTDEAIARYRQTVERWPDTFYSAQAEWFLRVAQQLESLRQAERSRG